MKIVGATGFSPFVGVRVGVAYSRNKLAHTRLHIYRPRYPRSYLRICLGLGLWALEWAWKIFIFNQSIGIDETNLDQSIGIDNTNTFQLKLI